MKQIKSLNEVERDTLEAGFRHGPTPRFRQRCHALLLNAQGYLLRELGEILAYIRLPSVNGWLGKAWDWWLVR